jgi:hypothetical protein
MRAWGAKVGASDVSGVRRGRRRYPTHIAAGRLRHSLLSRGLLEPFLARRNNPLGDQLWGVPTIWIDRKYPWVPPVVLEHPERVVPLRNDWLHWHRRQEGHDLRKLVRDAARVREIHNYKPSEVCNRPNGFSQIPRFRASKIEETGYVVLLSKAPPQFLEHAFSFGSEPA